MISRSNPHPTITMAHSGAVWPAIRPRRFGYSGRNGLARNAGLPGKSRGSGPHRHRVFRYGGAGASSLHTEIHKYVVNGEEHWANVATPRFPPRWRPWWPALPRSTTSPGSRCPPPRHFFAVETDRRGAAAVHLSCSRSGYLLCRGPHGFRHHLQCAPLWTAGTDGTGQTIAIVGETNINPQDVADFRIMFGLPAKPPTSS